VFPRVVGFFALLVGLGFWYGTWSAVGQSEHHVKTIFLSAKSTILSSMLVGEGLIYSLIPDRANALFGSPRRPTLLGLGVLLLFTIVGIGAHSVVEARVKAQGYEYVKRSSANSAP
jgi:hypothetical protein